MKTEFSNAKELVEKTLGGLRKKARPLEFDHCKPAEIEINEFFFENKAEKRVMLVLRSTGCEHYQNNQGCSMCGHYDGTTKEPVKEDEYIQQWESIMDGSAASVSGFDLRDFPIICLYNLGSLLNPSEVPPGAVRHMFASMQSLPELKKVIIESRPEYVTAESLSNITDVFSGLVEVGIGLESTDYDIRELCHHKNMPDLDSFDDAINMLREYGMRSLAYVNQKPPFVTEQEAIDDAIRTSLEAFRRGIDSVSIEPTSIQNNTLAHFMYERGLYRVPWLWSVRKVVKGIIDHKEERLDVRIGGYFDEEVLCGSQGIAPGAERNEIFPNQTSGNCYFCSERFVQAIKEFNRDYDLDVLYSLDNCRICYPLWQEALKSKDSRTIPRRIIEILGD